MSKDFQSLIDQALAVRNHYSELETAKNGKTWNAQDHTAGFVGDVGDLSKLVMAKFNLRKGPDDIDAALAHELSDCLWSIIVIADQLSINLEESFVKTIDQLHERIEKEKAEA